MEMGEIVFVNINDLVAHPKQNEIYGDLEPEPSFVASIREVGVLQPLLICDASLFGMFCTKDVSYGIIAGHRRRSGADLAGLEEVPCVVKKYESYEETEVDLLLSNLHRNKSKKMLFAEFEHYKQIACQSPKLLDTMLLDKLARERGFESVPNGHASQRTTEKIAELTNSSNKDVVRYNYVMDGSTLHQALDENHAYLSTEFVNSIIAEWEKVKTEYANEKLSTRGAYDLVVNLAKKVRDEAIARKAETKAIKASKEELKSRKSKAIKIDLGVLKLELRKSKFDYSKCETIKVGDSYLFCDGDETLLVDSTGLDYRINLFELISKLKA